MQYTTNYNLNLVEGTDIVNPLVQQNPNYSTIDAAMFANKQASVGTGTELTAGTVHTITRMNPDSNYVRFTATSNWTAGDTMVVDSTPVSVYLSDGTTPATGAYVINTEVLILVNGSRVTLLTSAKDEQTAAQLSYDNTASGLSATNVQDAIDEVTEKADGKALATVTADGVKTNAQLLAEIWSAINIADVTPRSVLARDTGIFNLVSKGTNLKYVSTAYAIGDIWINTFTIGATCSLQVDQLSGTTSFQRSTSDYSSAIPTSGTKFTLYA